MAEATDPRRLAFAVLIDIELHGAYSGTALGQALAHSGMNDDDRRLAARLVYGVLAQRLLLDHSIRSWAARPIDDLVAIALRLGLFQIACLERVPAYAAVSTTVDLVRSFAPHAAGFANALLRRATREGLAAAPGDEPARSAVLLSHPEWLVEIWRRELGNAEADALMRADNEPAPTVLRALVPRETAIAVLHERGVPAEPAEYAPDAIRSSLALVIPGVVVPQGEASQLAALFVAAGEGERILDACAAPGGKAAYLAKLVGDEGRVVAVDSAPDARERIGSLCDNAGVRNVEIVESAIENSAALGEFDAVLVDAPCSGLGTLREHPEIRWRRTPRDIEDLARRQTRILEAAAGHVRRGGRLVYATCTITSTENDGVIDAFLAAHGEFREDLSAPACPLVQAFVDGRGRLRIFPHVHGMTGFFAARLLRE